MAEVKGCHFPDDHLYDVENHVWYEDLGDGTVRVGMTSVAAAMAGELVAVTPKKVGRAVKPGKSCATIESGKWVGPARLILGGEVIAVNEDLATTPNIPNSDPYGAGWLVVVRPDDWESGKAALVPGTEVAGPYEAKMDADGFDGCG